jgi:hypothetical protein
LQGRTPLQIRTIASNDEATPWSKNNHLMGARLLHSSDDSENTFSRDALRTRTEVMVNQAPLDH